MTIVLDPFMAGVKPQGLQRGRGGFLRSADDAPYVTDPNGATVKTGDRKGEICRVKYGSPSNRGREIENDAALVKYRQRLSFLGIGMDTALAEACRDLALMDADSDEFKHAADKIAVEADKLTRSWLAADRGTHGHLICQRVDEESDIWFGDIHEAGEALGLDQKTQLAVADAWGTMLYTNGLEILAIEASCVDDKWRLAGTLDRIVRTTKPLTFAKSTGELVTIPANTVLVGDIKFGKCRLAHPIQIASYAQSVPYDTETETRGEWGFDISQEHALIFHGSFDPPSIELVWVDLVAGREHGGQCVVDAKAWAARDDVFSVAQIVEGAGDTASSDIDEGFNSPPSTLSPAQSRAPVAGEVEGTPSNGPPSPAPCEDGDPCLDGSCPSCWPTDDCDPHGIPRPPRLAATAAGEELGPSPDSSPALSPTLGAALAALDPADRAVAMEHIRRRSPAASDPTVNDLLPRQGMPQHALDEIHVDRLNDQRRQSYDPVAGLRGLADPAVRAEALTASAARLAVVDARGSLCASPDEGHDWSSDDFAGLWDELRGRFDALDGTAKTWRSLLVGQATRRNVAFHVQQCRSERRYWINTAVIALAANGDRSDILRELLSHVIGDVALHEGVEPGHALGSLTASEAERFAAHVDAYLSPPQPVA